jgi:AGZA family xanthine/uracil permease-like MFS transporter
LPSGVRKATPRAALLSTLAGIALSFISLGFLFRTFAHPIIGLITLGIVLLTYFGRVRFKGHLPGGVVAVSVGTLIAWTTGLAPVGARPEAAALHLPIPVFGDLFASLGGGHVLPYLSVIIAMSLFQTIFARCRTTNRPRPAGDRTTRARPLLFNGVGSDAAPQSSIGSASLPRSTLAIPGEGARRSAPGYSVLNGAVRHVELPHGNTWPG